MAGFDLSKIKATLEAIPEQFSGQEAKIGWFPTARYEDGTPVAYVALIQEKGAPEVGIPARPFMQPAVDAHKDEWVKLMGDGVRAVIRGKATAEDVLEGVGLSAVGDVQEQIESGAHEPLSPTTILLRKWRREGRTITGKVVGEAAAQVAEHPELIQGVNADPLRDSGLMVATLSHAVGKVE